MTAGESICLCINVWIYKEQQNTMSHFSLNCNLRNSLQEIFENIFKIYKIFHFLSQKGKEKATKKKQPYLKQTM